MLFRGSLYLWCVVPKLKQWSNPNEALTLKGRMVLVIIRLLLWPLHFIRGKAWQRPPSAFEEDPATFRFRDIVWFSYKYYFRSPVLLDIKLQEEHNRKDIFGAVPDRIADAEFDSVVTLHIGGDLMPYKMINRECCANLWDVKGEDFFSADIVVANLETPYCPEKKPGLVPEIMLSNMYFNATEEQWQVFTGFGRYKGYDVLSIANNHMLDQGEAGLLRTMEELEKRGVKYCGGARQRAAAPCIIERRGIRIGFIAWTYSLNALKPIPGKPWLTNLLPLNREDVDLSPVREEVKALRDAGAEAIVASVHAGNAYQLYPSMQTVQLHRRLFEECGVDLIAGGHPHNPQPDMWHSFTDPFTGEQKWGYSVFSLGDFVAYDIFRWCHSPLVLKAGFGRLKSGKVILQRAFCEQWKLQLTDGRLHFIGEQG